MRRTLALLSRRPTLCTPAQLSSAFLLIDVGSADSYNRAHIPGAVRSPLRGDLKDPHHLTGVLPSSAMGALFDALGLPPGDLAGDTVVYDTGEALAACRLAWLLSYYGVPNVRVLDGGFTAYLASGRPVRTSFSALPGPAPAAAQQPVLPRTPAPQRALLVGTAEVLAASKGGAAAPQIIDARTPAEFAGADARGLPRVGHVPGAVNVPFQALLQRGAFLPAADLRAALQARGVDVARPAIVMCLAGVRAAVVAAGVVAAGGEHVAVYEGSAQEWAADPSLPIVEGS
jgi:thiosulfate/3-mercaptopyruvate sulfurtransferase